MKLHFIKSACVMVEHEGIKVLSDPWLTDGIYFGSWYHYPPLTFTPEDFADVDYIYLTHIHPDHTDIASLKRLPKNIPVLIHDYAEKFLYKIIKSLGFEKVIEMEHKKPFQLGPNFQIESLAADNCDPRICGKLFGCNEKALESLMTGKAFAIDSMAVFKGGDEVLVNTNDCMYEMSKTVCDYVHEKYPKIELLLVGYNGAGPYPQCYLNLTSEEKEKEGHKKRMMFYERGAHFVAHLNPSFYLPFAGQYTLGGKYALLNRARGIPEIEEVPYEMPDVVKKLGGTSELVLINSGDSFDLKTKTPSAPFIPPDPDLRKRYVENVLKGKSYLYENEFFIPEDKREDLTEKLLLAQEKVNKRHEMIGGIKTDWTLYFDVGQPFFYKLPFNGEKVSKSAKEELIEPYLVVKLDYSLFMMLLNKKAHWNNAEIGSHLQFERKPNIYKPELFYSLYYFTL